MLEKCSTAEGWQGNGWEKSEGACGEGEAGKAGTAGCGTGFGTDLHRSAVLVPGEMWLRNTHGAGTFDISQGSS